MATKPQTSNTRTAVTAAKGDDAKIDTANQAASTGDSNETAAPTKHRIATQKIILHRNGERVTVKAGQKFAFTVAELKGLQHAVREPINENQSAEEVVLDPVVPLQRIAQPGTGTGFDNSGDPEEL